MDIPITIFGGMIPAMDDLLLPDSAAALSENTFLYSGTLASIPIPKELHTLTTPSKARVYRLPKSYDNSDYLYESKWMEFDDAETDVIRAPSL